MFTKLFSSSELLGYSHNLTLQKMVINFSLVRFVCHPDTVTCYMKVMMESSKLRIRYIFVYLLSYSLSYGIYEKNVKDGYD